MNSTLTLSCDSPNNRSTLFSAVEAPRSEGIDSQELGSDIIMVNVSETLSRRAPTVEKRPEFSRIYHVGLELGSTRVQCNWTHTKCWTLDSDSNSLDSRNAVTDLNKALQRRRQKCLSDGSISLISSCDIEDVRVGFEGVRMGVGDCEPASCLTG